MSRVRVRGDIPGTLIRIRARESHIHARNAIFEITQQRDVQLTQLTRQSTRLVTAHRSVCGIHDDEADVIVNESESSKCTRARHIAACEHQNHLR